MIIFESNTDQTILPLQDMHHSIVNMKKAFEHCLTGRIPKGELWLGTDLFKKVNLEDNLDGHIELAKRLGHDFICLPLSRDISMNKTLNYRFFSLKEIEEASKISDFFLAVIIDGPFQRLAEKKGLMKILTRWKRERHDILKEYKKERAGVDILIMQCLELSVNSVVIADDLAGESSTFVDPCEIQDLFSSFYIQAVSQIHKGHSYALFHSCGNIRGLIPQLISFGFDGLAAIQHRTNDLIGLKKKYGTSLTLMAGIDAEILESAEISMSSMKEFETLLKFFASQSGFILCSSCGLFSGDFFEKIKELYRIADELYTD